MLFAIIPARRAVGRRRVTSADDHLRRGAPVRHHVRTLCFYEAKRLIAPQRQGAIRLYRRSGCERLTLILAGRRLGFTPAEIRDLLGKPDGKTLQLTREQCVARINALEQQKRNIEIAIAELRQIYSSFYKKLLEQAEGASR